MPTGRSTLRIGSRAAATREPRQVRKEAALSAARRVPRTGLVRADRLVGHADVSGRRRVHGDFDPGRPRTGSGGDPPARRSPGTPDQHARATLPPCPRTRPRRPRRRPATRRSIGAAERRRFDQIVGQDAVVETLRNAVRLDRLAHGFLFVGPRGTGKTSMARILAKAVNCPNLVDGEPCDACPACVAIREGRALDVVELDAASQQPVDDMRELLPRVYTAPRRTCAARSSSSTRSSASRRAGTSCSRRSRSRPTTSCSSSARPIPARSVRPSSPASSASPSDRCPSEQIEGKLRRILEAEGRPVDRRRARPRSPQRAAGGMRDAESMLDQVLSSGRRADRRRRRSATCSAWPTSESVDALRRCRSTGGDALDGIAVLDELEADGRDLVAFADQVVARLREQLVARARLAQPGADGRAGCSGRRRPPRSPASTPTAATAAAIRLQLELAPLASRHRPIAQRPGLRPARPPTSLPVPAAVEPAAAAAAGRVRRAARRRTTRPSRDGAQRAAACRSRRLTTSQRPRPSRAGRRELARCGPSGDRGAAPAQERLAR